MAKTFSNAEDILSAVGAELGPSEWVTIEQDRINQFADATDDHQWIHVDAEKAASGPFGATIAHGYLTLSLCSRFLPELFVVENMKMGVNVGVNKVRFTNAVKVGSRIRGKGELVEATQAKDGGVQMVVRVTVEIEGEERPACIADTISRFYF
ncbi:MAG: MaoC family dehydratase [Salinisphaeraceae bacterium]|nr:MaoC family dehydratase [Salinisphaeraceae bacterium]